MIRGESITREMHGSLIKEDSISQDLVGSMVKAESLTYNQFEKQVDEDMVNTDNLR